MEMTERRQRSHLLMRRPHLEHLPAAPALAPAYTIDALQPDADLAPLAETLAKAFNYPWDVALVQQKLTQAPDVKAVYVVRWQGRPVATASSRWIPELYPDAGYVHWVATHPDHQGRGLTSALSARLLDDFRARGYREAVLETDDFRISAIKVYLRAGFVPVYAVGGEDHQPRWSAVFQQLFAR